MNILFLTSWYPDKKTPWKGIFIKHQALAVAKNYNVIVVAVEINNHRFSPFLKYISSETHDQGLQIYRISVNKSFPIFNQLNFLFISYWVVSKIILKHNIDIIHSHVSYPAGFLGRLLKSKHKIPFLITEHMGPIEALFRTRLHKQLVRSALKNANIIVAVSSAAKKRIAQYTKTPVVVVSNFINPDLFSISNPTTRTFNLGFLGGLNNNKKNLDILLEAFSRLNDSNINLHIGGTGELLPFYKKKAKDLKIYDRCVFHGGLHPSQVAAFYSKIHIFILPSKFESFGIVAIEAMACGIPVISIKHAGPEDYINPNNGILVEPGDVNELLFAIIKIKNNYNSYNRNKIRRFIEENFTSKNYTEKILPLYRSMVK